MYMSKREQAMQIAQKQGYNAFPYGQLPEEYKEADKKYLKVAWEAGWKERTGNLYDNHLIGW